MPVARPPHAGKALGAERTQDVYIPLKLPLDSARHAPGWRVDTAFLLKRRNANERWTL